LDSTFAELIAIAQVERCDRISHIGSLGQVLESFQVVYIDADPSLVKCPDKPHRIFVSLISSLLCKVKGPCIVLFGSNPKMEVLSDFELGINVTANHCANHHKAMSFF
jgi:hypothetical protein